MKEYYLCLYCWHKTRAADLVFSCPICTGPADSRHPLARSAGPRRVSRVVNWWKRPFGIRLHKVRCPNHGDTQATFRCPICKTQVGLDATLQARTMAGVGIAGCKGSGKTMMMLEALPELGVSERYGRAFHILGIGSTDQRIQEAQAKIFAGGSKPDNTDPHQMGEGYGWRARAADDPDDPELLMVMSDLGGEVWTGEKGGDPDTRARVDRYAGLLEKVVLVLDGAGIAADLLLPAHDAWDKTPRARTFGRNDIAVLGSLLTRFGDSRAAKIELALAISKGDLLWDQSERLRDCATSGGTTIDDSPVRELLIDSRRGDLITWADKFKEHKVFIFSSLGFRPEAKDIDAMTGKLRRPPDPVGVSAPIRWLLDPSVKGAG